MAPVMAIIAGGVTAAGQVQEGNAADAAGKFSARQNLRNSKSSLAEGIRKANETQRIGNRAQSDASAAIAASGGVTDDVGSIKTLSDIQAVTDYNALSAIYEGGLKSESQSMQAQMDRMAGTQAKNASRARAAGTVLSTASSAYSMGTT